MIFVHGEDPDWEEVWGFEGPGHLCLLCGEPVGDGQVAMWSGADATETRGATKIFFHPGCIPSFCRRILMDFEKAEI